MFHVISRARFFWCRMLLPRGGEDEIAINIRRDQKKERKKRSDFDERREKKLWM